MNCDELKDLILFYAGGVAEEEESRHVLVHLGAGCPRCTGRLVESRAILAPLPLVLDPAEPGPEVRERLMARVAATGVLERERPLGDGLAENLNRQARGVKTDDATKRAGPPARPILHPRSAAPGGPVPEAEPEHDASARFVRMWVIPSLAAALAAAFAGLAVYTPMNRQRLAMEARMAQQEGRLRVLHAEVEKAKSTLQLLRSPAVQVVSLTGAEAPRAAGRILWDRTRRQWHFFATNLAPLGPGRTYQLWFITPDQRMVSAGTFDVDPSGQGELVAAVPEDLPSIALAAVTDEPAGGVPQPTGKIQIKGEIPTSS